jgi:hypothetical protein
MDDVPTSRIAPPEGLAQLFSDPPLVGDEKREDFDRFFATIVIAIRPANPVTWIYVNDFVHLSWEISRERKIKADIIKSFQTVVVRDSLTSLKVDGTMLPNRVRTGREARQWATDPKAQREHEKQLSKKGIPPSEILAQAFVRGGRDIDAIDRRIFSYELRRMSVLKTIEHYNETVARRLEIAASAVIEGEFTEAAE